MKELYCEHCGRQITDIHNPHTMKVDGVRMYLCNKHFHQQQNYGEFLDNNPRTQQDKNDYEINGDIATVYTYDKNSERNGSFIIDAEDLDRVLQHKWRLADGRIISRPNGKLSNLGAYILNVTNKDVSVDYINKDLLDNRKCNLRIEENRSQVCEVCGATKEEAPYVCYCRKAKKVLCTKHRHQFEKYGRFLSNTCFGENVFIIHDTYAEIELRNRRGEIVGYTKIDIEDVDRCRPYRWHLHSTGYAKGTINGAHVSLHRFVMNYFGPKEIDHINRTPSDNRKCNLRIVSRSENMCNTSPQNNTGYKNIRLTPSNTYLVSITRDKKCLYEKRHKTLASAIETRDKIINEYNKTHNRAC